MEEIRREARKSFWCKLENRQRFYAEIIYRRRDLTTITFAAYGWSEADAIAEAEIEAVRFTLVGGD